MLKMSWKETFKKYAKKQAPDEACGLLAIIKGEKVFWPCKNLAEGKFEFFILDPDNWAECEDTGEIIGVIHSHPKGGEASPLDKRVCDLIKVPFYIYLVPYDKWLTINPC